MKLSELLKVSKETLNTRTFFFGGQKFRVRVPLTIELDAINKRVIEVDSEAKAKELLDPMFEKRKQLESDSIVFIDNDVLVEGRSTRELAKMTAQTEQRILEMIKLLVPENKEQV